MGWELRRRLYLYRSRRENGRPVKTYLAAAASPFGFGQMMGSVLVRVRRREARLRELRRRVRAEYRSRIDDLVATTVRADHDLRVLVEGVLYALGYHKHKRSEWRRRRDVKLELVRLGGAITVLERRRAEQEPVLHYAAPESDAEAVEVFATARAGGADALARVRALIRERKWQE